jgi:hypothetical protein
VLGLVRPADEAARVLRDCYGVPVGGVERAPQWVTANLRPAEAPPDSESLSLDLARLDLWCRGNEVGPSYGPQPSRRAFIRGNMGVVHKRVED